jgi:putative hemolysin
MPGDPFQIDGPPNAPLRRAALVAARPFLSWLLKLEECRRVYLRVQSDQHGSFAERVLDACNITATAEAPEFGRIPKRGPLIVAANHPHGALDGLVMASIIATIRPDVRLLANHLLDRIPELSDLCFFVDPFGGPQSAARSRAGLRAAHLWLRRGGCLVIFPSGEVAHERRFDGSVVDAAWHATMVRLARTTGAAIVPSFIPGSNSALFYAAGRVHAGLRTLLLSREFLRKRGQPISIRFGSAIAARDLDGDDVSATRTVRESVNALGRAPSRTHAVVERSSAIETEIASLPPRARLVESGNLRVLCAEPGEIPETLREIGRLRESAFRAVGEGTGRDVDLDRFDDHYLHLFAWDQARRLVVGAYRIGRTDRIISTLGVEGLYTRSLFRYDARLIERVSPALELGRSFIRLEYQRNHNALMLLWKGIGRFVVRHPRYRVLFGPVSISTHYSDTSHQLLMAFLSQNRLDGSLAELVQAINPKAQASNRDTAVIPRSLDEINRLVMKSERDGKGMPVLLRQYLKLNARLLGFNVDPDFGSALDALMMVDLTTVDRSILNRYLGADDAERFLALHLLRSQAAA